MAAILTAACYSDASAVFLPESVPAGECARRRIVRWCPDERAIPVGPATFRCGSPPYGPPTDCSLSICSPPGRPATGSTAPGGAGPDCFPRHDTDTDGAGGGGGAPTAGAGLPPCRRRVRRRLRPGATAQAG